MLVCGAWCRRAACVAGGVGCAWRWRAGLDEGRVGAVGRASVSTVPGRITFGIWADDSAVSGVERRPAAGYGELGGDARQGVSGPDRVANRCHPAWQHQNGAGMNDIRIRADHSPVSRVKSLPAAAHCACCGDAGQRVTWLHDVPRRGLRRRGRRRGRRSGVHRASQSDRGSTTRDAHVRLGPGDGPSHAGHQKGEQHAPGKHHARGLRPHTQGASLSFLRISGERSGSTPRHEQMGKERSYAGGTSGR